MIPQSLKMAESQKIAVTFIEEIGDSPVGHPNTATMVLERDKKKFPSRAVPSEAARLF